MKKLPGLVREIHLVLAAFVAPFLLVYIVSALVMQIPLFEIKSSTKTQYEVGLPAEVPRTVDGVAEYLRQERGITGSIKGRVGADGLVRYDVKRLGSEWNVELAADSHQISVQQQTGNAFQYLDRIHRHSGIRHGAVALDLWGLVAGGVAASLFLFGASGIYLWFLRVRDRRVGVILLTGHALVTIAVLALVRLA